jgi:hypothetical protein
MSPILKLDLQLDVEDAATYMTMTEEWDRYKYRTMSNTSPHREASDIYARFGRLDDPKVAADEPFVAEWYNDDPLITYILEPLVQQVYDFVGGESLGGVLVTKIPAGKKVYPHIDKGWHATAHSKYCVCIAANQDQVFCYHEEGLRSNTGDCFFFDNSQSHWVENNSLVDRISMIVCVKTPRGIHVP